MSIVLLIAVPLFFAFLGIILKKAAPYFLLLVSFFNVLALGFISQGAIVIGGYSSFYGIQLVLNSYSLIGLYVVNTLFFVIVAINCFKHKKLSPILLISLAGLNGLLLTNDLFNLFVFMEIAGISAYLITTTTKDPKSTFNYLVLGTIGSSFYLLGLIILYAMFGVLNIRILGNIIEGVVTNKAAVALPFLFIFIGLGVETKLLPFNSWVKGILGKSNALTGPLVGAVYASAFAFVFGNLLRYLFVFSESLLLIVSILLVATILIGEAMAYASTKVREILLFSSIAQAGVAVLVFALGYYTWGTILIALNGFSKLILYLVVNIAVDQVKSDELSALKGLFVNNKLIGAGFSVATLSILGLPIFAGFIVKMNILVAMANTPKFFFVGVILLASLIEGIYFIKLLINFWFEQDQAPRVKYSYVVIYVTLVIALLITVFGVYLEPLNSIHSTLNLVKGVVMHG
ncbi:MAG: NADH-ubiquinone oxidoreductase [Candidatus Izimaplasma sp.]|nr:NADH-ubiquinone oxidoreductase [Candidatus Izimaplasma bacterium]